MSRKHTRRLTNADTLGKPMPPFWRDGHRFPEVRGRFVSEERAREERGYLRHYNPNTVF